MAVTLHSLPEQTFTLPKLTWLMDTSSCRKLQPKNISQDSNSMLMTWFTLDNKAMNLMLKTIFIQSLTSLQLDLEKKIWKNMDSFLRSKTLSLTTLTMPLITKPCSTSLDIPRILLPDQHNRQLSSTKCMLWLEKLLKEKSISTEFQCSHPQAKKEELLLMLRTDRLSVSSVAWKNLMRLNLVLSLRLNKKLLTGSTKCNSDETN